MYTEDFIPDREYILSTAPLVFLDLCDYYRKISDHVHALLKGISIATFNDAIGIFSQKGWAWPQDSALAERVKAVVGNTSIAGKETSSLLKKLTKLAAEAGEVHTVPYYHVVDYLFHLVKNVDNLGPLKGSISERIPYFCHALSCPKENWHRQVLGEDDVSAILERTQDQSFGCELPDNFILEASDKTPAPPGRSRKAAAAESESSSDPETVSETDDHDNEHVSSGP